MIENNKIIRNQYINQSVLKLHIICGFRQFDGSLKVSEGGGGGIGFFGFPVLVIFEIGFSVFALKFSGFSVLVPTSVFCFPYFDIRFSFFFFLIKKAVSRVLLFACLIPRPHHFTSVNPFSVTSTGVVIRACGYVVSH